MPHIKLHKKEKNYVSFTITDTSPAFANSLRRILLGEVPTVTLDIIQIISNSSVLPDDLLVHRLGLIPMYKYKDLSYSKDCNCDSFCSNCAIECTLNVVNEHASDVLVVKSSEIKCNNQAVFGDAVIAKLAPHQEINIIAHARKGVGMVNAKWCPVTAVEFEYDASNEMRHTNFWCEENVEQEWPGVVEKPANVDKNEFRVNLGVEVLEGYESKEIIIKGLNVLDEKINNLIAMIENYQE
ncbi:RNA polymerase II subunit 3 [Conglomerata obtusa]